MADKLDDAARLTRLETEVAGLQSSVNEIARDQSAFVHEWRASKDSEARERQKEADLRAKDATARAEAVAAARPGVAQYVQMVVAVVAIVGAVFGGAQWLVETKTGAVVASLVATETRLRASIDAEAAKQALAAARQQDSITASQSGLQSLQRDLGSVAVKLGLVEQRGERNTRALDGLEHMDAEVARLEERIKALDARAGPPR